MRNRNPDNRYKHVMACVSTKTTPEVAIELSLFTYLTTKICEDQNVIYANEIYANQYEKEILNAFILSGATDAQLNTHLKVPYDVVSVYKHLYFDVSQFRDELDIFSWVREQEALKGEDSWEVQLLKQAILGGVDAMLWIYSRQAQDLDPKEVFQRVLADSYFRSKMHRGAPITSKVAKEAHAYMTTAMKAGDLLAKLNANSQSTTNDASSIVIKLGHRDLTQPISSLPNKDDLLH